MDDIPEIVRRDWRATSEKFTGELRWQGHTLQQLVQITEYRDGHPFSVSYEWRDVPRTPSPDPL